MSEALALQGREAIDQPTSSIEAAMRSAWDVADSRRPSRSALESIIDTVFATCTRAIERRDGVVLAGLSQQLGLLSKRYSRNRAITGPVYFAVYAQALADVAYTLSDASVQATHVQMHVGRSVHMGPIIHALRRAPGPLTHAALAEHVGISPSQLTEVAKIGLQGGAITVTKAGRKKYYSITGAGLSYLDEFERPFGRFIAAQVLSDYWAYAAGSCSPADARERILQEYSTYPSDEIETVVNSAMPLMKTQAAFAQAQEQLRVGSSIVVEFKKRIDTVDWQLMKLGSVNAVVEESSEDEAVFRSKAVGGECGSTRFRVLYGDVRAGKVALLDGRSKERIKVEKPRSFKGMQKALSTQSASS